MERVYNNENEIAYLIQAYADAAAFKNLVKVLLDMGNCHIFVHLDKKSDITNFLVEDKNVHFIDEREFVSWAGYNQGKLMFNLIDAALSFPIKFGRYCFISESDFPVYSKDELLEKIKLSLPIMINCSKLQKHKVERYWFYDYRIKSPKANKIVSKAINGLMGMLYKIHILRKPNKVILDGRLVDVYCSGPFWQFDYEQLKYINDTFKNNKKFQKYFKTSFAACELMVQTIIANSKYMEECKVMDKYINLNALSSLCYFKYTGPRVNVLTEEDYNDIVLSGKPFIRKVNVNKSQTLVEKIVTKW